MSHNKKISIVTIEPKTALDVSDVRFWKYLFKYRLQEVKLYLYGIILIRNISFTLFFICNQSYVHTLFTFRQKNKENGKIGYNKTY